MGLTHRGHCPQMHSLRRCCGKYDWACYCRGVARSMASAEGWTTWRTGVESCPWESSSGWPLRGADSFCNHSSSRPCVIMLTSVICWLRCRALAACLGMQNFAIKLSAWWIGDSIVGHSRQGRGRRQRSCPSQTLLRAFPIGAIVTHVIYKLK